MFRTSSTSYFDQTITNIQRSYAELVKLQNQVQTQEAMERPSDDPIRANQALMLESNLKELKQYESNIQSGSDLLTYSDQMLDSLMIPLTTAIEKVQQGLNAETSIDGRHAIASELDSILSTFVSVGNAQLGDKNIFGGSNYLGEVFSKLGNDILFNGNNDSFDVKVASNEFISGNITARDVFGAAATILDSDKNLNMRIPEMSLDSSIPVNQEMTESTLRRDVRLAALNELSQLGVTAAGTFSTDFDTVSVSSLGEFLDDVRDSLISSGTLSNAMTDETEAQQLESVLAEVQQHYLEDTTSLTLQAGSHIATSRLVVTLTESNNSDSKAVIDAINTAVLQTSEINTNFQPQTQSNKEINAGIAALSAFGSELSNLSLTPGTSLVVSGLDTSSSESFAAGIQSAGVTVFGAADYDSLDSDQKQAVDAAVQAAKNSFASSEFKALQTRSGISITHENDPLVRVDRGLSDSAVVHALELGQENNGSIYTLETDLTGAGGSTSSALDADQVLRLELSDGSFTEVDLFQGDTTTIVAKRINRAVNVANVDSGLRRIVAREDTTSGTSTLVLSSENQFKILATDSAGTTVDTDFVGAASNVYSALHGTTQAIEDLRNGSGLTTGTQKLIASSLTTDFDSTISIEAGDSFEYVLQQLNDLAGFEAVLNDTEDGITLRNMSKYAMDTVSTSLSGLAAGDTLTLVNDDNFDVSITLAGTNFSEIAEEINLASSSNFYFHAEVNASGDGVVISSNENFSATDTTNTVTAEDLSSLSLIESDMSISLGLNHNEVIEDDLDDNEVYVEGTIEGSSLMGRQVRLKELNDGDGIFKGSVFITVGSATQEVDLSSADTLRDVKILMEEAFPGSYDVSVNDDGNGLAIVSNSSSSVTIKEANGGSAGRTLGLIIPPATSATGTDIQGTDIDPRFSGQTRLKDLNGGTGIDSTGFVITNGDHSTTVTLDSDGDGRDDIRNMKELVNHINRLSKQDQVFIEATLDPENGGLTITSKLANTTLEISEKAAVNTAYTTEIDIADLTTADTLQIFSADGSETLSITISDATNASTVVSDINAVANAITTGLGVRAFVNADGNVELISHEAISVSDTDTNFGTTSFTPNPSILGRTASDLGLLGAFSGETMLSTLNNGNGITNGTFQIQYGSVDTSGDFDSNATTATVDIEFAETLSDIKNAIEDATNDDVLVSFGRSNRIELTLASADDSQRIEISEIGGSSDVASSLGLLHDKSIMGRELRDGTQNILTASTTLVELGKDDNTYENLIIEVDDEHEVVVDLSSAITIGDVIAAINSSTSAEDGESVNLQANIVNGRYLSIVEGNGNTLEVISTSKISSTTSALSTTYTDDTRGTVNGLAELLGLEMNPLITGEAHYLSTDLSPMHQADNFFSALTTLRDEFADGVVSQDVVSNTLTRLESLQGKLLQARGDAGGRIARFELLETRYQDESLFVEGLYGEKVSIDILEVTQRYLQQQQVYEAGLSVASRILGTSLFSFI